jgi:hypothetical protein
LQATDPTEMGLDVFKSRANWTWNIQAIQQGSSIQAWSEMFIVYGMVNWDDYDNGISSFFIKPFIHWEDEYLISGISCDLLFTDPMCLSVYCLLVVLCLQASM